MKKAKKKPKIEDRVYEIEEVNDLYINDNTAADFKEWLKSEGYKLIKIIIAT